MLQTNENIPPQTQEDDTNEDDNNLAHSVMNYSLHCIVLAHTEQQGTKGLKKTSVKSFKQESQRSNL